MNKIKKILLVEDHIDAANVLSKLLSALGFEVDIAYDGYSGINMAHNSIYDFILLDIGIPDINGYEVAHQIRNNSIYRDAKLIALTGYGREEDKMRSFEAGFNFHLIKPVGVDELRKVLV